MKKNIMLSILIGLPMLVLAQEQEQVQWKPSTDLELLGYGIDLHGTVGIGLQSQYLWRGFDFYGDDSAIAANSSIDFSGTGFGVSFGLHRGNGEGHENRERLDLALYYKNTFLNGDILATDVKAGWGYYNFPDNPSQRFDLQEIFVEVHAPEIMQIKGLVPGYSIIAMWPSESDSDVGGNAAGFLHFLMMDYSFPVTGPFPEIPEYIFTVHSELCFNEGVSPFGNSVDRDWSHGLVGLTTDIDLGFNVVLKPGVFYQMSLEESVNNDDNELFATISAELNF